MARKKRKTKKSSSKRTRAKKTRTGKKAKARRTAARRPRREASSGDPSPAGWRPGLREALVGYLETHKRKASALGRAVGVSHTAVLSWKKGTRVPADEVQERLAAALRDAGATTLATGEARPSPAAAEAAAATPRTKGRGARRKASSGASGSATDPAGNAPAAVAPATAAARASAGTPRRSAEPRAAGDGRDGTAGAEAPMDLALRLAAVEGAARVVAAYAARSDARPDELLSFLRDARRALEG